MPNNPTYFEGEGVPIYPGGSRDAVLPEAIPIILVPGCSGSNLRVKVAARDQVRHRFEEERRAKEYTDQAWALPNKPPNIAEKAAAGFIEATYCSRVILVTHSMGGLVARAAAQLEKEKGGGKILGIIHGLMPAIGAPETYRMVVAGEVLEGTPFILRDVKMIQSRLLGPTRADATAVIANAQGPLELLPSHLYSPRWLQIERQWDRAEVREEKSLPQGNNPYDEIYREKEAPWRMVDPALLDPASNVATGRKHNQSSDLPPEDPWDKYIRRINRVEKFHKNYLKNNNYHIQTFIFYSANIKSYRAVRCRYFSKNSIHKSFSFDENKMNHMERLFKLDDPYNLNESDSQIPSNSTVDVRPKENNLPRIMAADGMGDGTVPEESGKAPEKCEFVRKNVFHIPSLKHQEAFNSEPPRVFAVLAICKLTSEWKG